MRPPTTATEALLHDMRHAPGGLTLAELLAGHPELARRTVQRRIARPDPLRLAYRDVIRRSVRDVVRRPGEDPLDAIRLAVEGWADAVAEADRENLEALVVEELRRLHEGALARYGLRPAEYRSWRNREPSSQ